jgi:hypothetical protein
MKPYKTIMKPLTKYQKSITPSKNHPTPNPFSAFFCLSPAEPRSSRWNRRIGKPSNAGDAQSFDDWMGYDRTSEKWTMINI